MPVQFQREDLAGYRVGADTVSNAYNQGHLAAREEAFRQYQQKNDNMNRMVEARKQMDRVDEQYAMFLKGINPNTGQPLGPISPELWESMKDGLEAKQKGWTGIYDMANEQLPIVTTYQTTTDENGNIIFVTDPKTGEYLTTKTYAPGRYSSENVMHKGRNILNNSGAISNPPQSGGQTPGFPLNFGAPTTNAPQQQASSTPYTGAVGGSGQHNVALHSTVFPSIGSYNPNKPRTM